jgi:hypothetical protein
MTEPTISASVQGGSVGVGAASFVIIGTQYIGAPLPSQPSEDIKEGVIPLCPYPGLAYFGPQDGALFFGREAAIAQLRRPWRGGR